MFVVVAVSLLPVAAVTLAALSWWEERLFGGPAAESPRHARTSSRRRHLRLIHGGRAARAAGTAAGDGNAATARRDAA